MLACDAHAVVCVNDHDSKPPYPVRGLRCLLVRGVPLHIFCILTSSQSSELFAANVHSGGLLSWTDSDFYFNVQHGSGIRNVSLTAPKQPFWRTHASVPSGLPCLILTETVHVLSQIREWQTLKTTSHVRPHIPGLSQRRRLTTSARATAFRPRRHHRAIRQGTVLTAGAESLLSSHRRRPSPLPPPGRLSLACNEVVTVTSLGSCGTTSPQQAPQHPCAPGRIALSALGTPSLRTLILEASFLRPLRRLGHPSPRSLHEMPPYPALLPSCLRRFRRDHAPTGSTRT